MNHDLPRITIVTPSFNQAAFLEATIRSVLDQRYPNLQFGVVDGGSTDGSRLIIERYQDQLDFAIIEPDDGQVDAINKGLALADGEVVGFLNSDDTLEPGALRTVGEFFRDHPEETWCAGHCRFTDADGQTPRDMPTEQLMMRATPIETLSHILLRDKPVVLPQPSIFWRRGLTDRLGAFRTDLHFAFDFDMWCRFLAAGHHLTVINRVLSTYRLHEASKTCTDETRFLEDHVVIERQFAKWVRGWDRIRVARALGYRQRRLLLQTTTGRPWRAMLRRPWWLASRQIRTALLHGRGADATTRPAPAQGDLELTTTTEEAAPETWDSLYDRVDVKLAKQRLAKERASRRWQQFEHQLRDQLGDRKLRCVELGSGGGDFSMLLAMLGHEVTLVDFSDAALSHARQRFEEAGLSANFVQGDLFEFATTYAGCFDVSVSLGVVEHFAGPKRRAVIEAHRQVLRPGGLAMISAPNAGCVPYRLWKFYLETRGCWPYGYEAPFSGRELRSVARDVGLDACRLYRTGFAASVDGCLLLPLTGKRRGWGDGPGALNRLSGWDVNLIARAA